MTKWIEFEHHKPVWKYAHRPTRVTFWVGVGRQDDFQEVPPARLGIKLRLGLWQSFWLAIRLPDWLDLWWSKHKFPLAL